MEPAPIKRKICLLGAFSVGKTSLVRRFVSGMFSERYLATIGVKIDRRVVRVGGRAVDLILWDIAGGLHESRAEPAYLRGTAGYMIVGDGTRADTCRVTQDLLHYAADQSGERPHILLLNKSDLASAWILSDADEASLRLGAQAMIKTSAKTGAHVDQAFYHMALEVLPSEVDHGDASGANLY